MSVAQTLTAIFLIALSGCDSDVSKGSRIVESQKGRWQYVAANPPYPALLIDTATGCIETLDVVKDGPDAVRLSIVGQVGTAQVCGTMLDLSDMQKAKEGN